MADEVLKDEDDFEVVEVDTLPPPGETPKVKVEDEEDDKTKDEDDAGDGEDARLVASDDDDDDDADAADKDSPAHKKRLKRRQIQKAARDRTLNELNELKAWRASVEPQLAQLHSSTLNTSEAQVDARINDAREDIATADRILAAAIAAGNGEDAAAALRLRDDAKATELELTRVKGSFTKARETPATTVDPNVSRFSAQFKADNASWYGVDPMATETAKVIDNQVAADGYNPATPAYWQELTRRLRTTFKSTDKDDKTDETAPRRRAPPQGQTREHAPVSTRKEVYVTPERKQAMILAGKWDDPVERRKMLKAYEQYDREQSAGN